MLRSAVAISMLGCIAFAGATRAQEPVYRIQTGDLNFSKAQDRDTFKQRVEVTARDACYSHQDMFGIEYKACLQAFREEADNNLKLALDKNSARLAEVAVDRH
jgi:UrcA family protein